MEDIILEGLKSEAEKMINELYPLYIDDKLSELELLAKVRIYIDEIEKKKFI